MTNDFAKAVIQKLPLPGKARLRDTERFLIKHCSITVNRDFHCFLPSSNQYKPNLVIKHTLAESGIRALNRRLKLDVSNITLAWEYGRRLWSCSSAARLFKPIGFGLI